MRKIITTIFLGCTAFYGFAQAPQGIYQFADPGFEQYTSGNEPGFGWNSFASATGSMSGTGKGMSPNPCSITPGANNSQHAVKIFSKQVGVLFFKANANGNLTTGIINMGSITPTDASNHNFSKTDDPNHSLLFAGRPDQVTFYAKFKAGANNSGKVGRANFILHGDCQYRDPEVAEQEADRIGKASFLIPESADWVKYVVDFDYDRPQPQKQFLLASLTTNPVAGESVDDELCFDEVQFVYHHGIKEIAVGAPNQEWEVFKTKENVYEYELTGHIYDSNSYLYTLKGAGATSTETYDESTGILTITVKGNDFSVNPNSISTYRFKFDLPTGIENMEAASQKVSVYDVNGRMLRLNVKNNIALEGLPSGVYIINGKKVIK